MNSTKIEKLRLDQVLVDLGLSQSKEKAQALIISGSVLVDDKPLVKPGTKVNLNSQIRIRENINQYVSRGAYKLKKAIEEFKINIKLKKCLDIGASTGGFTQILLEYGAKEVVALDVGYNQLDWKIRSDPRVKVIENQNARYITKKFLTDLYDVIVMDVSFISVEKIVPHIKNNFTHQSSEWIILIKPQFEIGKDKISKGGIVKNKIDRENVVQRVIENLKEIGLFNKGLVESPIKGAKGNVEFLAYFNYT